MKKTKTIAHTSLCTATLLCTLLISACVSTPPEKEAPAEDVPVLQEEHAAIPEETVQTEASPVSTEETPIPEENPVIVEEIPPSEETPAIVENIPPSEEIPVVGEETTSSEEIPVNAEETPPSEEIPVSVAEISPSEEIPAIAEDVALPEESAAHTAEISSETSIEGQGESEDRGLVVETARPVTGITVEYVPVEVLPEITFKGRGVKVEAEQMLLADCSVEKDFLASGIYAVFLDSDSSRACFAITLPAGRYECLACEKAFDTEQSVFHIIINDKAYRVYPSNPPLGSWELTIRTPIQLELEEETRLFVSVQPHSTTARGETGMQLDYLQFVLLDNAD